MTLPSSESENSEKTINDYLKIMALKKGSDMLVTAGAPVSMKLRGQLVRLSDGPLTQKDARELVLKVLTPKQREEFERTKECNFAISVAGVGRFRVNTFYQQTHIGMVIRRIEMKIPTFEELDLPEILKSLAMQKRGIVFMVGATGTGKSTTMAALLGYRNVNSQGHIITIEDPIEYVHRHQGCVVTQREIGVDTESWDSALKNSLRQAPDVILIGEVRTKEAMDYALSFAETGHLVLCTLHANNANQAIERILNFFPDERKPQLLMDLSLNLKGIVAQQLVPKGLNGESKGLQLIMEIMLAEGYIKDLIREGKINEIKTAMTNGSKQGMQTFDMSLVEAHLQGHIPYENALAYADSQNEVRLQIKLANSSSITSGNLEMAEKEQEEYRR